MVRSHVTLSPVHELLKPDEIGKSTIRVTIDARDRFSAAQFVRY
jgi:hypothetical protein